MSASVAKNEKPEVFGIFAVAEGFDQPLIMLNLPFGRLMEDIVIPLQQDEPFFVDGVLLKKKDVRKLKILRLRDNFAFDFSVFNHQLKVGEEKKSRILGDQYNVRLEAMFRENGEDVTSQVVTAFDKTIKPSLKDYLPRREELIKASLEFFLKNLSQLAGLPPSN